MSPRWKEGDRSDETTEVQRRRSIQTASSQNTEFELDPRGDIQPVQSIVDCRCNAAPSRQLKHNTSGRSHHSVQLRDKKPSSSTQQTVNYNYAVLEVKFHGINSRRIKFACLKYCPNY